MNDCKDSGGELTPHWYVIYSKPHKEWVLWRQLQAFGFEVFFPRFLTKTGDLSVLKIRPYFPDYLFVKVDLNDVPLSTFQWMPFAIGLVCFGGKPANVPDVLIEAIHRRLVKANAEIGDLLDGFAQERGGEVECPLKGYDSIFDTHLSGDERVVVFLQMLQEINVSPELSTI